MAAKPPPSRELAALHERIGRDLAELRLRLRGKSIQTLYVPGDLLEATIKVSRSLRLGPAVSQCSGMLWAAGLGAAAGLAAGRYLRSACRGKGNARGL